MRRLFVVLGVTAIAALACMVDVPPPDAAGGFACETSDDCAPGYYCNDNKRCQKSGPNPTDACNPNPCVGTPAGPICTPSSTSGHTCSADCSQASCPAEFFCVRVEAAKLECRPKCASEGTQCSTAGAGAVCAVVYDKNGTDNLTCVACDPVAQPGGCSGGATCKNKGGAYEYYQALQCVGSTCSGHTTCVTPPLTSCGADSRCHNPCDDQPCAADRKVCIPTTAVASRYECRGCDVTTVCTDSGTLCAADAGGNVCVPSCATTLSCPDWTGHSKVCTNVSLASGSGSACAYCPVVCPGTATCQGTGSPDWNSAAICSSADPCAGCPSGSATDVCVGGAGGTKRCVPKCGTPDTACTAGSSPGWCVWVKDPGGVAVSACVTCTPACGGGFECRAPAETQTAPNSDIDVALSRAACVCPPNADGWFALGSSACDRGISSAVTGTPITSHSLTTWGGLPLVAWSEGEDVKIRTYDPIAGSWIAPHNVASLGKVQAAAGGLPTDPVLAVLGNVPRLAWVEQRPTLPTVKNVHWAQLPSAATGWTFEGRYNNQPSNSSTGVSGYDTANVAFASAPAMALLPGTNPIVVWPYADAAGGRQILARSLVGTSWADFGGTTAPIGRVAAASTIDYKSARVGVDTSGVPYATYINNGRVFISKTSSDGTSNWTLAAATAANDALTLRDAGALDLFMDGTTPVVAFDNTYTGSLKAIYILELNGNVWRNFRNRPTNLVDGSLGINPAMIAAGGALAIAWEANPGVSSEIQVKTALTTAFDPVGPGGNASGTPNAASKSPRLTYVTPALGDPGFSGSLCASWLETVGGIDQLYLRCHDI